MNTGIYLINAGGIGIASGRALVRRRRRRAGSRRGPQTTELPGRSICYIDLHVGVEMGTCIFTHMHIYISIYMYTHIHM